MKCCLVKSLFLITIYLASVSTGTPRTLADPKLEFALGKKMFFSNNILHQCNKEFSVLSVSAFKYCMPPKQISIK